MDSPERTIHPGLARLLRGTVDLDASDLHVVCGYRPTYRIHGLLRPIDDDVLTEDVVRDMLFSVLPDRALNHADTLKDFDFSVSLDCEGLRHRFRGNIFVSGSKPGACFRHIPNDIPTFDWMSFPQALADRMMRQTNGLVIVTGITGSGKSTTLAACVNMLNEQGGYRIITVEEPIEYEYPQRPNTVISQREVGNDVDSFYDGLKYGLRQDPDVILIGEIRDTETARMALSAAETGHLILATMHTRDAKGAITRMVDLFPRSAQDDVRTQLSMSLRFVIAQRLVPGLIEGKKRCLALEVLTGTSGVRSTIKQGKIESLDTAIQTGRKDGMQSMDDSLQNLLDAGQITVETARRYACQLDNIRVPV